MLVAVGLDPVDEFTGKAREFGLPVYSAGDAEEIAEASAAMFAGKIRGLEIAKALGRDVGEIPPEWHRTNAILKSRPGAVVVEDIPDAEEGVFPILHCAQEIPCNPCSTICPQGCIIIGGEDIRGLPEVTEHECIGCEKCVAICPGLAITLVDYRKDEDNPIVTIAYEFLGDTINQGDVVTVLDTEGAILGNVEVVKVRSPKMADRVHLVRLRAPKAIAKQIAGIRVQEEWVSEPLGHYVGRIEDDAMICRCERVTAGEIRALIRQGIRDMNEVKALTRAGMGACGAKTCTPIIKRIFREEGVPADDFVESTQRPVFVEVPLGVFAGVSEGKPQEEATVVHATDFHEGGL